MCRILMFPGDYGLGSAEEASTVHTMESRNTLEPRIVAGVFVVVLTINLLLTAGRLFDLSAFRVMADFAIIGCVLAYALLILAGPRPGR